MSRVLLIRTVWRVGFGMTVLQCGVLDRNTEGFCRKPSALWVNVWNQHHTTPHWGGIAALPGIRTLKCTTLRVISGSTGYGRGSLGI